MKVGIFLMVLMLIPMAVIQANYKTGCEDPISDYEMEVLCK